MEHFKKGRLREMSTQEELEMLREDPTAQDLLHLLEGQGPERTNQLMTMLTTLADKEDMKCQDR